MSYNMKKITSRSNPLITQIVQLHDAKGRAEQGLFIAQGKNVISSLLASGMKMEYVFATTAQEPLVYEFSTDAQVILVDSSVINKISTLKTPSGIMGVFRIPQAPAWKQLTAGVVTANITDPGNLGTILRTCAAFGVKSLVTIDGVDLYNPKLVQASAGTLGLVTVFKSNWQEFIEHTKDFSKAALVVKDGIAIEKIKPDNLLLMIGNEAHGIPHEWLEHCDKKVTIHMKGYAQSLNAAIAAGIAIYSCWGRSAA